MGTNREVTRVAVKPEMWLQFVERNFRFVQITSKETKFNYVLTELDPRVVIEVEVDLVHRKCIRRGGYSNAKKSVI